MNAKNTSLILVSAVALTFVACANKKPQTFDRDQRVEYQQTGQTFSVPVTTTQTAGAPKWIDNPDSVEGLSAVGISPYYNDKDFQRTVATANSYTRIAQMLNTKVQAVFNQYIRSSSAGGAEGSSLTTTRSQTVKQLIEQQVTGAKIRAFWNDRADGRLYVLVSLSYETAQEIVRKALAGAGVDQGEAERAAAALSNDLKKQS